MIVRALLVLSALLGTRHAAAATFDDEHPGGFRAYLGRGARCSVIAWRRLQGALPGKAMPEHCTPENQKTDRPCGTVGFQKGV